MSLYSCFGIALLFHLIYPSQSPGNENPTCQTCDGDTDRSQCPQHTCAHHKQVCSVRAVLVGGHIRYWGGCVPPHDCNSGKLTTHESHGGPELCGKCCDTTGCNTHLCEIHEHVYNPYRCLSCRGTAHSLETCTLHELCQENEKCVVRAVKQGHITMFYGGCVRDNECKDGNLMSHNIHGGTEVCGKCCHGNNCNRNLCAQSTAVNQCMSCVNENVGWNCSHVETCGADEVCFIQELQLDISIPSLPSIYYHGGCINKMKCSTINTSSVADEHGLATVVRGECCSTKNCNRQVMRKYELQPVSQCMTCVNENFGWTCSHVEICASEEVCFIQELHLDISLPSFQSVYYHGGCIKQTECTKVNTSSVADEHGLATVVRGECCSTNNCNRRIMKKYEESAKPPQCMICAHDGVGTNCTRLYQCSNGEVCFIQQLQLKISFPSLPSIYYHAGCISNATCSTIASVSVENEHDLATVIKGECCSGDNCNKQILEGYKAAISTSGSGTTTTLMPTTATSPPMECEVCAGSTCEVTPGSDPAVTCPTSRPYCMTTVQNLNTGDKAISKRRAAETECNNKWWERTVCIGFHPSTNYNFPFTCSYCCTTPRCNMHLYPDTTHLYMGHPNTPLIG